MIKFINENNSEPFLKLKKTYLKAIDSNQQEVQALLVASYSKDLGYVDARFVNLKIIDDEKFIFFSNYNSPKSNQFMLHPQISTILYWSSINTQIRMKAYIERTSSRFSDAYFRERSKEKNALAISSNQSKEINSYSDVKKNYHKVLNNSNLNIRPEYWGGFEFIPFYIEFWQGHESRINKREVFEKDNKDWIKKYLQP